MGVNVKLKLNAELAKIMEEAFDQYHREQVLRTSDYISASASMNHAMSSFNYVVKDERMEKVYK